jgi:preprotein translocase subunit SecG
MIKSILMFLFVLDAALLMVVVLLQDSKGQGLGGAFGGGGQMGTAIFGGRGAADFLSKATTWLGTGFLVLAIVITLNKQQRGTPASLLQQDAARNAQQQQTIPQTGLPLLPGTSPVAPDPGGTAPPDTSGAN